MVTHHRARPLHFLLLLEKDYFPYLDTSMSWSNRQSFFQKLQRHHHQPCSLEYRERVEFFG